SDAGGRTKGRGLTGDRPAAQASASASPLLAPRAGVGEGQRVGGLESNSCVTGSYAVSVPGRSGTHLASGSVVGDGVVSPGFGVGKTRPGAIPSRMLAPGSSRSSRQRT